MFGVVKIKSIFWIHLQPFGKIIINCVNVLNGLKAFIMISNDILPSFSNNFSSFVILIDYLIKFLMLSLTLTGTIFNLALVSLDNSIKFKYGN